MTDRPELSDMPITSVVQQWMTIEEWQDDIEIFDERNRARVETGVVINEQQYRLYLETDERMDLFNVFLYSPLNPPPSRISEIARAINYIHGSMQLGRLWCFEGDDILALQYKAAIDLEGSSLSTAQISVLVSSGIGAFDQFGEFLSAVAMNGLSAEQGWSNFLAKQKEEQEQDEAAGPAEL